MLLVLSAALILAVVSGRPAEPLTWAARTTAKQDEPWYRQPLLAAYEAFGTKLMGPVEPEFFGGEEALRRMLQEALDHEHGAR